MKIKCPKCEYIFEIETHIGTEIGEIISCFFCNNNIIVSDIKNNIEENNIKNKDTNELEYEKKIFVSLKSTKPTKLLVPAIISIINSLLYLYLIIFNEKSNITIICFLFFSIFLITGFCLFIFYKYGIIKILIGKNSYYFCGIENIIGKRININWDSISKMYIKKSLFIRGNKYYIIFIGDIKYKLNVSLLNEEDIKYIFKALIMLRFNKIE